MRIRKTLKTNNLNTESNFPNSSSVNDALEKIPKSIVKIKTLLEEVLSDSSDFVTREIIWGNEPRIKILIAYIDGLVDKKLVSDTLLNPILEESRFAYLKPELKNKAVIHILQESLLSASDLAEVNSFNQTIQGILAGDTIIFIDGEEVALKASLQGGKSRGIAEPETEVVVRGPREGFSEILRTNTALLRRKIINPNLKMENLTLGKQTNTAVCIAYIKGIADERVIDTVRTRLKAIDTDAILESGYIEEFIEDAPYSLFSTVGCSEKPDVVAAKILEGRIAILCNGTPFVLTVPYLWVEAFQTSEDYYMRPPFASVLRILRVIAFLVSTLLPGVYLALISFNPGVIPFKLLITIVVARRAIPYSTFIEAVIMLLIFELLREAGVRIPRQVGQAVSIVGALVLGDAAVRAGLVSTPIVIVTAITAITSFIVPSLSGVIPFLRLAFLIGANILGLLGMTFIAIFLMIYMSSIRSFGVPYLSPFAPVSVLDLKDTIIRFPLWAMLTRPSLLTRNKHRTKVHFRQKEE